jgi:plastocyanin
MPSSQLLSSVLALVALVALAAARTDGAATRTPGAREWDESGSILALSSSSGRVGSNRLAPAVSPAATGVIRGRIAFPGAPAASGVRATVTDIGVPKVHAPVDRRSVVYLDPAPRAAFDAGDGPRARMDQRNETFVPHVLAIVAGTVVDFPNSDQTYHNVFSLSKTKSFDLGRYAVGRSKAIRFERPGIVRVFCDIHSHMSAFILVFAHRYFAVTDEEGHYRIESVPPGTYTVMTWNESAPLESQRVVIPDAGGEVELNVALGRR